MSNFIPPIILTGNKEEDQKSVSDCLMAVKDRMNNLETKLKKASHVLDKIAFDANNKDNWNKRTGGILRSTWWSRLAQEALKEINGDGA